MAPSFSAWPLRLRSCEHTCAARDGCSEENWPQSEATDLADLAGGQLGVLALHSFFMTWDPWDNIIPAIKVIYIYMYIYICIYICIYIYIYVY